MSYLLSEDNVQDIWWSLVTQFLATPTTITSDVAQGQTYTQLSVASMPVSLNSGDYIQLGDKAEYLTQQVQLSSSCNAGDTTLNVDSFTANYDFPSGTTVLPLSESLVSVSWPTDGEPSWSIEDDVCFLRLILDDAPLTETADEVWGEANGVDMTVSQSYLRGWFLGLIFYGQNALDNASSLRSWLRTRKVNDWVDNTAKSLGGGGLSIIPKISQPMKGPELYNGQWWKRVNLTVRSYELVQRDEQTPVISDSNTGIIIQI